MSTYPIKTCLWFDTAALDAAQLYTSLVPDSEITDVSQYTDANQHGETGRVLQVDFRLGAQHFVALNGGPHFTHSPAASIQVYVPDQLELDRIWGGLIEGGGSPSQCGWCVDRFGVSWQVIPTRLIELLHDPDRSRSERAVAALLQMSKLDIAALEAAADGAPPQP